MTLPKATQQAKKSQDEPFRAQYLGRYTTQTLVRRLTEIDRIMRTE